jgi:hypothetical protein
MKWADVATVIWWFGVPIGGLLSGLLVMPSYAGFIWAAALVPLVQLGSWIDGALKRRRLRRMVLEAFEQSPAFRAGARISGVRVRPATADEVRSWKADGEGVRIRKTDR